MRFMINGHIVLSVLVIAAGSASLRSPSRAEPPGEVESKLSLEPCRFPAINEELRCGVINVPEDRAKPAGRRLPLKVVVIPARSSGKGAEPIFYFEGGPGQAATEAVRYLGEDTIRRNRDVVLIDQRGTGPGHYLDCDLEGSDQDLQGYLRPTYPALQRCAAELSKKADLTKYTTSVAMQDADDVRRALGYDKIIVYGGSYGSRASFVYAKMFGRHVRAAYMSGAVPFEAKMPLYQAATTQRAFDASIARCAADRECRQAYPDPKGDLAAIKVQLQRQPARVAVKHPATGAPAEITIDHFGFVSGLMSALYAAEAPSAIPSLLRTARNGDFTSLAQALLNARRSGRRGMHWGMNAAVICNEDVRRIREEEVQKATQNTFAGSVMVDGWRSMCAAWPIATYPAGFFEPFKSEIPALIVSGEFDPVTPPQFGDTMQSYFVNSKHLILSMGHSFGPANACFENIVGEFLRKAAVDNLDLTCASAGKFVRVAD